MVRLRLLAASLAACSALAAPAAAQASFTAAPSPATATQAGSHQSFAIHADFANDPTRRAADAAPAGWPGRQPARGRDRVLLGGRLPQLELPGELARRHLDRQRRRGHRRRLQPHAPQRRARAPGHRGGPARPVAARPGLQRGGGQGAPGRRRPGLGHRVAEHDAGAGDHLAGPDARQVVHDPADVVRAGGDAHRGRAQRADAGELHRHRMRRRPVRPGPDRAGRPLRPQGRPQQADAGTSIALGPGQAAIRKAVVALPSRLSLDLSAIKSVCSADQAAADTCPADSAVGTVTAVTPLLASPLSGPVSTVAIPGSLFPGLRLALDGLASCASTGSLDLSQGHLLGVRRAPGRAALELRPRVHRRRRAAAARIGLRRAPSFTGVLTGHNGATVTRTVHRHRVQLPGDRHGGAVEGQAPPAELGPDPGATPSRSAAPWSRCPRA